MLYVIALLSGIVVTAIGALPFGLVNLSVLNISYKMGVREGMRIAHGAALVEVLFGSTAVLAGVFIHKFMDEHPYMNYILLALIGTIGVVLLFKNNEAKSDIKNGFPGFWKGVFLNLVSVQVLLYWIIAIAFLNSHDGFIYSPAFIVIFLAGIWAGKMGVLWIFARSGRIILSKSNILAKNMNRVIGAILIIAGIFQILN